MDISAEYLALVDEAQRTIREFAPDPRHSVACAIRTQGGQVFSGVNVFAQGGGACAELVVLGMAISFGQREFDAIVAVGDRDRGVVGPCGVCRQLLLDYAPEITVILPGPNGLVLSTARDLLPNAQQSWFAQ